MEENTTSLPSSENTFTVFDYNMNNHTNSAVAMGRLDIQFLATSHVMFKIGECILRFKILV